MKPYPTVEELLARFERACALKNPVDREKISSSLSQFVFNVTGDKLKVTFSDSVNEFASASARAIARARASAIAIARARASARASARARAIASASARAIANASASVSAIANASASASAIASAIAIASASAYYWFVFDYEVYYYSADVIGALQIGELEYFNMWYPFFEAFESGLFMFFVADTEIVVATTPSQCSFDNQGRLHGEEKPAMTWLEEDFYFWHGVEVPERAIMDIQSYSVNELLREENTEVRRALMSLYGWENIIENVPNRLIDRDPDPIIGDLWELEVDNERVQVLIVQNGTPIGYEVETMNPVHKTYAIPFFRRHFTSALDAGMSTYPIPRELQDLGIKMTADLYRQLSRNRT